MGKGARNRAERAQSIAAGKDKAAVKRKRQKRNKKIAAVAVAVIAVLAAGAVAAGVTVNILSGRGYFLRNTVSAQSTNYQINNAMMSYLFYSDYNNYIEQNSDYLAAFGLDTTLPLKEQSNYYGTGTWYDYFLNQASEEMKTYVIFAEEAKAKGYTLTDEDQETIDGIIKTLKSNAASGGYEFNAYLDATFGKGVREEDIRAVSEIAQLAQKYYTDYTEGLTFTQEELDGYRQDNPAEFITADYMLLTLGFTTADDGTSNEEEIRALANQAAACKTEAAFKSLALDYFQQMCEEYGETFDSDTQNEYEQSLYISDVAYSTESDAMSWVFDSARTAGETYIEEDENSCSVYFLLSPGDCDRTVTKNVRHILLTSDTYATAKRTLQKAEELLDGWKNGEMTEDSFAALAEEYSEDPGSNENGGLYENVYVGQMVDTFEEWCFDPSRKPGDTGIVETDYGYHIMYFVGDGAETWTLSAKESLTDERYDAYCEELAEKYAYTVDDVKLGRIKEIEQ